MIADGQPTQLFKDLASTKWNAQIIRIPVNSQWYLWNITSYPAPSTCQFASLWAGKVIMKKRNLFLKKKFYRKLIMENGMLMDIDSG